MKQTIFTMLIAGSLIMMGLSACKKEAFSPIPSTPDPRQAQQVRLNLVAENWVDVGDGMYRNVFPYILSNLPIVNGSSLKVYVVEDDQTTLINTSPIIFKGHPLWISTTRTDLTLYYQCPHESMPFRMLHIEVAVN